VDGGGNDEGGALDLLNRINIVLNYRIHERFIEAMRGSNDHMQRRLVDPKRAALRQRIEQVERLLALLVLFVDGEPDFGRLSEERLDVAFVPFLTGIDNRRAQRSVLSSASNFFSMLGGSLV